MDIIPYAWYNIRNGFENEGIFYDGNVFIASDRHELLFVL